MEAIFLGVGIALGAALLWALLRRFVEARVEERNGRIAELSRELEAARIRELASCDKAQRDAAAIAGLESTLAVERRAADDKMRLVEESKARLADSFRALSSEALERNGASFLELARASLEKFQE